MDGNGVVLRGRTIDEVLEVVERHRAVNGLALGNPEAELIEQYLEIAPFLLAREGPGAREPGRVLFEASRAMVFLRGLERVRPKPSPASEEVVEERMKHCRACPHHEGSSRPVGGEVRSTYEREVERRMGLATGSRRDIPATGWCRHHGQWVGLLGFFPSVPFIPSLPPPATGCWVGGKEEG